MTYKKPRLKIAKSMIFCLGGRLRLFMTGNGRQNMAMSVTRLKPAMTYHIVKASRHRPGRFESQNLATGTQMRILRKAMTTVHTTMKIIPYNVMRCMIGKAKTRRYWKIMPILTRHMAILYTTTDA